MLVNEEQTDSSNSDGTQPSITESSQKKKKRKKHIITANLSATRYKLVHKVVEDLNFHIIDDENVTSYLIWNDSYVTNERVAELQCYQRINHFPGMAKITRKDCLARNFQRMQKVNNEEFNFHPLTWIMPIDYTAFTSHLKNQREKKEQPFFIIKPSNGAQGHGIYLCKSFEKSSSVEHSIVQEYIEKPLLIDGYKFDLRLYVLITSCDPLRIFVFKEGLVRLSTEPYYPPSDQNLNNLFMHLTNYSINKHNEYYEKGMTPDSGSKRSIKYLNKYLRANDYNVSKLWQQIYDLIIKTMIIVEPHLLHAYRNCRPGALPGSPSVCFEILGFDVIIDQKLKPWLLEVNRSPSLGTDQKIDFEVKSSLLEDALRLLHIKASDKKRNRAVQKAQSQKRLFRGIQKIDKSPTKGMSPKKSSNMKRKEELLSLLDKFRRNAAQEAFENENCGQFYRIFPSDDKLRQQKYTTWMTYAFIIFQSDVKITVPKDVDNIYNHTLQEEDILNLLAEFEEDESSETSHHKNKNHTQKLYHSHIQHIFHSPGNNELTEEEQNLKASLATKRGSVTGTPTRRIGSKKTDVKGGKYSQKKPVKCVTPNPPPADPVKSRSLSEPSIMTAISSQTKTSINSLNDKELTKKALQSLNDFQIKFPGKNDSEVEQLLSKVYGNWKLYKSSIASYWLIKLDSVRRRKIIDIVKSNVLVLFQKIWKYQNIEETRLFHLLQKVFNRLLWSHGQGLWSCFSLPGNSWEVILNKSSENVSEAEMECCRRVVKLCQNCLLIVYQFATEAKQGLAKYPQTERPPTTLHIEPCSPLYTGASSKPTPSMKHSPTSNSAGDVYRGGGANLMKTMTKMSKSSPGSIVDLSLRTYAYKKNCQE